MPSDVRFIWQATWETNSKLCRFWWPRGVSRGSAAACLLGLRVWIPLAAWMFVSCEFCALSGRGLCVGLIPRPEESYSTWCVQWVWSRGPVKAGHDPESGRNSAGKKLSPLILDSSFILQHYINLKLYAVLCVVGWEVKQKWISNNFEGSEVRLSLRWCPDIYQERICKLSKRHPRCLSLNCCCHLLLYFAAFFFLLEYMFVYLFISYLVVLSVAQIIWDLTVGISMNNKL